MTEPHKPTPPTDSTKPEQPIVVETRDLFRGCREVLIVHEGVQYRLRLTRRNKLILQK